MRRTKELCAPLFLFKLINKLREKTEIKKTFILFLHYLINVN